MAGQRTMPKVGAVISGTHGYFGGTILFAMRLHPSRLKSRQTEKR